MKSVPFFFHAAPIVLAAGVGFGMLGCSAADLLRSPEPVGVITSSAINTASAAEGAFFAARTQLFTGLGASDGVIEEGELLSDEFTYAEFISADNAGVDARMTEATKAINGFNEPGDTPLGLVVGARSNLLAALGPLETYATGVMRSEIGYTYALVGYSELFMAEDYCAGVPLTQLYLNGGFTYGQPISADSLLAEAEVHFDTALAEANGSDSVTALASIGLGRTLLDRGQYAAAATAVANVATGFVYNVSGATNRGGGGVIQPTFYEWAASPTFGGCGDFTVSDREGTNGLNFISANDPRLMLSTQVAPTCDATSYYGSQFPDSIMHYPMKFGTVAAGIPIATGVEARLIQAEAALHTGPAAWATALNALRADSADTHVVFDTSQVPIKADSTTGATDSAQIDLMFRERAFWLFGTGVRLGDMRRLVRQYQRTAGEVYPTGTYVPYTYPQVAPFFPSPLATYGTDVDMTLPTPASSNTTANPYYKGCIVPTSVA